MGAARMAWHTIRRAAPASAVVLATVALTAPAATAAGTFTVSIDGPGAVRGGKIDCVREPGAPAPYGVCSEFVPNEVVCVLIKPCMSHPGEATVTASGLPGSGFGFDRWTGACSGYGPACSVPVTRNVAATAVFRDTEAPTVGGLAAVVSGTIPLHVDASDNVGVTRVDFSVRGVVRTSDTNAPYVTNFDTTTVADGPAEITATAFDALGNSRATTMNVTIDNTGPALSVG